MKITRIKDPKIVPKIASLFVLHDEDSREAFVKDLMARMIQAPESLLFVAAIREDDVVGFVIAQNLADHRVWVAQAWSEDGNDPQVADELFMRVLLWASALGKTVLGAETTRNAGALLRRFGFCEKATLVEYTIPPGFLPEVIDAMRGVVNG